MRVLVAFGTRPEIIKLGPVCKALQDAGAELDVFWSGQHIELAAGLHGYLLKPMPYWQRAVAIVAALMLVAPELTADLVGFAMMAVVVAAQQFGPQPAKLASVGAAAVDRSQDPPT